MNAQDISLVDNLVGGDDASFGLIDMIKGYDRLSVSLHIPEFNGDRANTKGSLDIQEIDSLVDSIIPPRGPSAHGDNRAGSPEPFSTEAEARAATLDALEGRRPPTATAAGTTAGSRKTRSAERSSMLQWFGDRVRDSLRQALRHTMCDNLCPNRNRSGNSPPTPGPGRRVRSAPPGSLDPKLQEEFSKCPSSSPARSKPHQATVPQLACHSPEPEDPDFAALAAKLAPLAPANTTFLDESMADPNDYSESDSDSACDDSLINMKSPSLLDASSIKLTKKRELPAPKDKSFTKYKGFNDFSQLKDLTLADGSSLKLTPPPKKRELPAPKDSSFKMQCNPDDTETPLMEMAVPLLDGDSFGLTPPPKKHNTPVPPPSARTSRLDQLADTRPRPNQASDTSMDLGSLIQHHNSSRLPGLESDAPLADLSTDTSITLGHLLQHHDRSRLPGLGSDAPLADLSTDTSITLGALLQHHEGSRLPGLGSDAPLADLSVDSTDNSIHPNKPLIPDWVRQKPSPPSRPVRDLEPNPKAIKTSSAGTRSGTAGARAQPALPRKSSAREPTSKPASKPVPGTARVTGPVRRSAPATANNRPTQPQRENNHNRRKPAPPPAESIRSKPAPPSRVNNQKLATSTVKRASAPPATRAPLAARRSLAPAPASTTAQQKRRIVPAPKASGEHAAQLRQKYPSKRRV